MESEIIQKAQDGDTEAFENLMTAHQTQIFQLAYRMLDNRDDALDVVQEAFYRAWRSLKKFRGESSFRLWVETIATRLCISKYRKKRVFIGIEEIIGLGSKPNWDDEIDADKYRKAIASALKRLTARERMAFVLRMEEKYSTEEVAKVMNISKGTVKTLLHRAKEKMKKFLRTNLLDEFGSIKNE
ncbi:RNA polymerase sigma factor [bacterium]|nr:RNA polymerase sigma factor [bacterium]